MVAGVRCCWEVGRVFYQIRRKGSEIMMEPIKRGFREGILFQ